MSHLLSFLLIFSLTAEPALAASGDAKPAADPATQSDPAKPNDPTTAAVDPATLASMCKAELALPSPFKTTPEPKKPDAGYSGAYPPAQALSAQDSDAFEYAACDKVRASPDKRNCDKTLAGTFVFFYNDRKAHDDLASAANSEIQTESQKCVSGQTTAQKCMADIYQKVSVKYQKLADDLNKHAKALGAHYNQHLQQSMRLLNGIKTRNAGNPPALNGSKYVNYAKTADIATLRKPSEPGLCLTSPIVGVADPNTPFCGHVTSAAEAHFYELMLIKAADQASKVAKCYGQNSKTAQARADGNGNPGGGGDGNGNGQSTVTGKTGSGFGLDDIMKLGTLGMTGAALYCSVSKSCSPQQNNANQNADPNAGATSPTPNGQNAQQEVSSIGSNGGGTGSSQPAPGAPTSTAVDTGSSHGGGSGGLDSALQHFSGSLDSRAPASTPATGGGSSGGGSGGSGASLGGGASSSTAAATAVPDYKAPDGLGVGIGAGGLAGGGGSAGGFNLGNSATASPTDNALKNILNGDAPPGLDAALPPLGDAGAASAPQASDAGKDDPENLFNRVRVTHVRCLKRGCVGAGVGDNI